MPGFCLARELQKVVYGCLLLGINAGIRLKEVAQHLVDGSSFGYCAKCVLF
jgi:hypothetical protein